MTQHHSASPPPPVVLLVGLAVAIAATRGWRRITARPPFSAPA